MSKDKMRTWKFADPISGLDYNIVYRPSYIAVKTQIDDDWWFGRQILEVKDAESHFTEDKEWLVTFDDKTQMLLQYWHDIDRLNVAFRNHKHDLWTDPQQAKEITK